MSVWWQAGSGWLSRRNLPGGASLASMAGVVLFLFAGASLAQPVDRASALPSPERSQELLFEAARLGRSDLIAPLVKAGAEVNARDARGFTALILAAYGGHLETVDALMGVKADPCLADRDLGNTAQMGVAFRGHDAVAARLLRAGCNVDARNRAGQTALMMAALFGRKTQVEWLAEAGADPLISDAEGRTAESVAAGQGNTALAERLGRPRQRR